ncbi:universal stress protein, partial [Escherichia sp. TWPC-MK]
RMRSLGEPSSTWTCTLEMAKKIPAHMIIIASHRPDITTYLLGSNAAAVVRHAECSVLVVR